jgi:hypothetical protein
MAIYEIGPESLNEAEAVTYGAAGVLERADLQRLLRSQIQTISPDTMVICDEFGDWEDSRRRIDLLCLDKDANLIVIELKRTETGGHMELQAIRYAAMVSTMTFEQVVEAHRRFLATLGRDDDPKEAVLSFLEWDEADQEAFAPETRIVLAAAEFSRELATSVLWLNERGLDIRCVRMKPYRVDGRLLMDIQQVIPLPEAEDYQIKIREKSEKIRESIAHGRDFTRYNLKLGGKEFESLPKRRLVFHIVNELVRAHGVTPDAIVQLVPWKRQMFAVSEGEFPDEASFVEGTRSQYAKRGRAFDPGRHFITKGRTFVLGGRTYALTKMWGAEALRAADTLLAEFPRLDATYAPVD